MTDESRRPDEPLDAGRQDGEADPVVTEEPPRERRPQQRDVAPSESSSVTREPKATATDPAPSTESAKETRPGASGAMRLVRELVLIVVIALVASALLRAFVVQAYYVPSGSMLPAIHLQDRILVSRIGDVDRGEVVVFEDPGDWIPPTERSATPGSVRKALEWIGVLPATGHEHLVKRAVGLPGDHVVCCNKQGRLVINGHPVDESDFLYQSDQGADNVKFDVVVPKDRIFVLGDHRYVSGDSSRHLDEDNPNSAFVPLDNVVGRAFAVIWPAGNMHILEVPDVYDDVPEGTTPPESGIISTPAAGSAHDR